MSQYEHDPEALARRLEALLPPDSRVVHADDDDPLIAAARRLAAAPPAQLTPEAVERIQARVLAARHPKKFTHELAPAQPAARRSMSRSQPTRVLWPVLRWASIAAVVVLVALGGVTRAALASVPGDAFYPVKGVVEDVELALAFSPESEANVYLTHAERRVEEAQTLLGRGAFDTDLVDDALAALASSAQVAQTNGVAQQDKLGQRSLAIATLLDGILTQAATNPNVSPTALARAQERVANAYSAGHLLLPPGLATTYLEGRIEAIDGRTITINGIEIRLHPNDPLLATLQVGDFVRATGHFTPSGRPTGQGFTIEVLTSAPTVEDVPEDAEATNNGQGRGSPPDTSNAGGQGSSNANANAGRNAGEQDQAQGNPPQDTGGGQSSRGQSGGNSGNENAEGLGGGKP